MLLWHVNCANCSSPVAQSSGLSLRIDKLYCRGDLNYSKVEPEKLLNVWRYSFSASGQTGFTTPDLFLVQNTKANQYKWHCNNLQVQLSHRHMLSVDSLGV